MFNLLKYELFSRRTSIVAWGIGLAMFASMYIAVYPSMADQMAGLAQIEFYKVLGIDMASFAGYIASVVVQVVPIILGVYVITISTGTLAGEEDNGTLELIVAMPLPRWQIVAMKSVALSIVLFFIVLIFGMGGSLTLSFIKSTIEVDVTPSQLFVAMLGVYPVMLAFFSIGLFLGAFMPNRRLAVSAMTVFYISSFLTKSIAGFITSLESIRYVSLFSYVNTTSSVFTEGIDIGNVLVLLAVTAVFFGLAVFTFQGRNITVGQWPWQRAQIGAQSS